MSNNILLIEDNTEMQDLLSLLLEQEGYHVITALTGTDALNILGTKPELILILLDLTLPDMNAETILTTMKNENLGVGVPIVVCSALPNLKLMDLQEGVVGVIQKPFQINAFLKTISSFKSYPAFNCKSINIRLSPTSACQLN